MYSSLSITKLLNDIEAINPSQRDRWVVKPDELAKIGPLGAKHMTVEERLEELKEIIPLYQKYPPVYGNNVGAPFLQRISELAGRNVGYGEALDGSKIMLEVAQLLPDVKKIVNEARGEELQMLLNRKSPSDLTPVDLQQIGRFIGREVKISDVSSDSKQAELVDKVRRGELTGRLPSPEALRRAAGE